MIFVLNKCYGGWSLSDAAVNMLGLDSRYPEVDEIVTKSVANLIQKYGSDFVSGSHAKLEIVEIPDNYTDYEINDYDGIERITYVIDGKLYHA